MISRIELGALVVLAIAIFLGAVVISGGEISLRWAAYIGATITSVGLVVAVYDRWLWKWPMLQGWFVDRPKVGGVWNVTMKTSWVDPATGQVRSPVMATFDIKQTRTAIQVRMKSDESDGDLVCANIVPRDGDGYRFIGTFRNEPRLAGREKSPIHYGTFSLDIEGDANNPPRMIGHYWTDRETTGEMTVTRRGD